MIHKFNIQILVTFFSPSSTEVFFPGFEHNTNGQGHVAKFNPLPDNTEFPHIGSRRLLKILWQK